jgi:hypothetical protein
MGQEYFINSQKIEEKIRTSLPSQGGAGAGFDLSASTQIIPVIDITESSEGSVLRQDLQTAISFDNATAFAVNNTTSTLINSTGYWRVFGSYSVFESGGSVTTDSFQINDGATNKIILAFKRFGSGTAMSAYQSYDFIIKLTAGDSLTCTSSNALCFFNGSTRQIADIAGELS